MIESQARLESTSSRLASIGADQSPGVQPDTVDLSSEAVALLSARNQFSLNVALLNKANEIEKQTIDLLLWAGRSRRSRFTVPYWTFDRSPSADQ